MSDSHTTPGPGARPNILFVFGDQWRAAAAGYAGDPNVKTPHIDRLAARSVNFTNAISSCPVCTPARASLITGQYPHQHGLFLNDLLLDPGSISIGKTFRDAGYHTGWIGKWHLDGNRRSAYTPPERRQGFAYWAGLNCTHNYFDSRYFLNEDDTSRTWDGYDAYAQTDLACDYIRNKDGVRPADRPFMLMLSWGPPHDPYAQAPQDLLDAIDPEALALPPNVPPEREAQARRDLHGYYAHIAAMDKCVGQLLETLESQGQLDNTIFVLTSDHGDMLESHAQFNKQRPWDESLRVPLLMHWPERFGTEGCTRPGFYNITDHLPTLCSLAGIDTPSGVQGSDFAGHIAGGSDPSGGVGLYACYAPFGLWTRDLGGRECRGIRTARHTYVRDLSGPWLLYDNQADPWQQHNLIGQRGSQELVAQLDAQLNAKLATVDDPFDSADKLIDRWGYQVDESGTVGFT